MISGVFGLPGAGKSMFLAYVAECALDHKRCIIGGHVIHNGDFDHVQTNFPFAGCEKLDFEKLGVVGYENTLFLIDEISLFADSRNFKNFSQSTQFFFTQHRKFGNSVVWCSQSYDDTDKKIRNLTEQYFYIKRSILNFSIVNPIEQFLRVDCGKICSGYELAPLISCKFLYLPKYWDKLDSFQTIGATVEPPPKALPMW